MASTFTVAAKPVRETESALCVETEIHDSNVWLPKSVIHDHSEVWKDGQPIGDLVVSRWWALKEGWCDE